MLLALSVNGAAGSYPQLAAAPYKLIFIDVGQGDAALLIDPDGFTVLIDGGDGSAGPGLTSYIRELGIADIDVMVATHPHSDHFGGLIAVLKMVDVPVKSVVYNGYPGSSNEWFDFTDAVLAEGLTLTPAAYPDSFAWGAISALTLNPAAGLPNPDSNDDCLAFLVHTGNIKTLFACDLDSVQERVILDRIGNIDADLLKVAHHGSGTSSGTAFLDAVSPTEAIISVGDNSYGHPVPATIARLEDAGARIWRTDLQGTITVLTDGVSYAITHNLPVVGPMKVFLPLAMRVEVPAPAPHVIISTIFYDGTTGSSEPDEYVEIFNSGEPV